MLARRQAFTLLGLGALAPAVGPRVAAALPAPSPPRERIRDRYFPNVQLLSHQGRALRFYDDLIRDKIVLINFMYTACEGVCPGVTANLVKLQGLLGARMGKDIFIYSITLKPDQDTPGRLANYAEVMGAGPGWLFLSGAPDDIELVRWRQGMIDPNRAVDVDKSQHIGNVRYGNEPMMWWAACPGLLPPEVLRETISWVDWPRGGAAGDGRERPAVGPEVNP